MTTRHTIIDLDNSAHFVTQSGLLYVYGWQMVPPTLLADAAKVTDFGNYKLKRPAAIRQRLQNIGYAVETRFDATHGRRYMACAYPVGMATQERRVTIAASDGITNLRQYAIDSGIPASELPE